MADEWDDGEASASGGGGSFGGKSYGGKGRGFKQPSNDDEWGGVGGSRNGFGGDTNDNGNGFGSGGGRGRGGGRGGRGGGRFNNRDEDGGRDDDKGFGGGFGGDDRRGRGGGRGGGRFNNRDEEGGRDDDKGFGGGFGGDDRRGRGGGRGGGRFNNRDEDGGRDDDDRGFGGGFGGDDRRGRGGRGGGRGGRGSRGGRGGDDDDFGGGGGGGGGFGDDGDKPEPINKEVYIPADPSNEEEVIFGGGVEMGINFDKYDKITIDVSGENAPPSVETFEEAGLRAFVLENIKKSGYKKPTPVQKAALPIVMAGRDLMACAQTGSGKTAAFLVPMVNMLLENPTELVLTSDHCEPQVVIISPTRELTIQIYEQARKFSRGSMLKCVVAYGGAAPFHQAKQIMQGCHILVATPGRLMDFVGRGRIKFGSVRFFVLDEADRMLDMGFLGDIEKIMDDVTMVPCGKRQTLMFSATFPEDIQLMAKKFLNDYLFLAVGIVGGACSDVEQNFHQVTKFEKKDKLKELLESESDTGLKGILVFVETKRNADFIAAFLSDKNYPTTSIHGDRLQREREEALADFKSGKMSILVATAVAARGLDIPGVTHVVNYDLPKTIDEYVHRIGRTGRVGNQGKATSFFDSDQDGALVHDLTRILKQAQQPVPEWLGSGGGGGGGNYAPGRSNKFGGRDVRNFNDDNAGGEPYPESAYCAAVVEPEEEW